MMESAQRSLEVICTCMANIENLTMIGCGNSVWSAHPQVQLAQVA